MHVNRTVRSFFSLGALIGALALLLADSADPPCSVVPFAETYRVTTDCDLAGTEVVTISLASGEDATLWPAEVAHVEGDSLVTGAELLGQCDDDGDPAEYHSLTLRLAAGHACQVELDGDGTGECHHSTGTTCSVTVTVQ
jgi:hypothetical protein